MKIITNDYCYINKRDIANLMCYKYNVPEEIYLKAFPNRLPIVTEYNYYDFIEVDINKYKNFVKMVKETDWIIDLNNLNNIHSKELLEILKVYKLIRKVIIKRFNEMSYQEKSKNRVLILKADFLEYKTETIKDYLLYRLGQVNINIPEKAKERIKTKSKAKRITDFIYGKNKKTLN